MTRSRLIPPPWSASTTCAAFGEARRTAVTHDGVVFRREALHQLEDVYDFIADAGSAATAAGFAESIVIFCEGLSDFPYRGVARVDLHPGLRTIGFRKRVVIAYSILNETVAIIGIFSGGRDHEQILRDTNELD
ncbi:type II toxin-antitoxin system RelE/ParE family toxin [Cryobacterium mannosilyticum]|uniref:Type II toxin-antitoxin system RelE/ParE family toxin n=1 Tax=Cryobacterium mannosilyticum TaxID=1259190 RepID=A0A4R8W9P0_9MICO|nr:type II toxin-antitoxin system RelE/ParE family toxin [Cryobacterium mannosilyticum]